MFIKRKNYQGLVDALNVASTQALQAIAARDKALNEAGRLRGEAHLAMEEIATLEARIADRDERIAALEADLAAAQEREAEYAVKPPRKSKKVEQGI